MLMKTSQKLKTGTTTVGLTFKDGVILAADMKSTLGYLISSKTVQKVYAIDDKIAVTTAGGSGDTQALIRILRAEIQLYKLSRNAEFTVNAAKSLLSNILQGVRYYPYMAMMLVGGVDKHGAHVLSVDPVGGAEPDRFASTGSGSPMAYGVLEDSYKPEMTREEAIDVARRAISAARERDIFSGGKGILVAAIDKSGMQFIEY